MSIGRILQRFLILGVALTAIVASYVEVVRPVFLNWGATAEEQLSTLPGDEIVKDAASQSTRAITVEAPVTDVWPWVAQLGQDRGGFYSFDLLENLAGCDMPTTDVLQVEKQQWQLGDKLWMYPAHKAGGAGFATLRAFTPGHDLGFATRMIGTPLDAPEDGSWSFVLKPIDATHTRLLVRGRGSPRRTMPGVGFDRLVFDPIHFAMERRTMVGIKELAETGSRSRRMNHVHVVLWAVTFVLFVWAAGQLVFRRTWQRPLAGLFVAAAVFQILTLMQPSPVVSVPFVVAACLVVWQPKSRDVETAASHPGFAKPSFSSR